jgi:streptomycin 6-kinase
LVLKLAPATDSVTHEAHALAHWAGRGAVRLEAVDLPHGALLLERAVPGIPLTTRCAADDRAATAAAADVIAQLRARMEPTRGTLPTLASWTESLASVPNVSAVPELTMACREARAIASELSAGAGPSSILHGDLHHGNVLSAERTPWLAVDPKGLHGPREAEPAALLRNPRSLVLSHPDPVALLSDRLDLLAERLGDDVRRLVGWAYVLAVLAALWAFEDQEGDAEVRGWLLCTEALRATARARGAL